MTIIYKLDGKVFKFKSLSSTFILFKKERKQIILN